VQAWILAVVDWQMEVHCHTTVILSVSTGMRIGHDGKLESPRAPTVTASYRSIDQWRRVRVVEIDRSRCQVTEDRVRPIDPLNRGRGRCGRGWHRRRRWKVVAVDGAAMADATVGWLELADSRQLPVGRWSSSTWSSCNVSRSDMSVLVHLSRRYPVTLTR
jgi:hypothetical protein